MYHIQINERSIVNELTMVVVERCRKKQTNKIEMLQTSADSTLIWDVHYKPPQSVPLAIEKGKLIQILDGHDRFLRTIEANAEDIISLHRTVKS